MEDSTGAVKLAKQMRDSVAGLMEARLQAVTLPSVPDGVPVKVIAR